MAYTEARKRSIIKYLDEKTDDIRLRVPKGTKDHYKAAADRHGISMTKYVCEAVETYIRNDFPEYDSTDLKTVLSVAELDDLLSILIRQGRNLKEFLRSMILKYISDHKE